MDRILWQRGHCLTVTHPFMGGDLTRHGSGRAWLWPVRQPEQHHTHNPGASDYSPSAKLTVQVLFHQAVLLYPGLPNFLVKRQGTGIILIVGHRHPKSLSMAPRQGKSCAIVHVDCRKIRNIPETLDFCIRLFMKVERTHKCPNCKGYGTCIDGSPCPTCSGTGEISSVRTLPSLPCR